MDKVKGIYRKAFLGVFVLVGVVIVSCDSSTTELDKTTRNNASKSGNKIPFELVKMPTTNADSVYGFVQAQVDFGPRIPNSKAAEACAQWMFNKLSNYGFVVQQQKGEQMAYDGVNLKYNNIIGRFNPDIKNRILLTAHWDTRPWADQDSEREDEPIDGANDGGSGVAVILEIARVLKQMPPNIGVDVVLFDIEDYGKSTETFCYGSQIWSRDTRLENNKPMYAINLDMVGDPNAVFLYEGYSMQYARPILDKVWKIAKEMGHGRYFKTIPDGAITDDHLYVNKAGIPAIDIIHREPQGGGFAHSWHTHNDNMQNISSSTLKLVTDVVLQTIYREK